MNALRMSLAVGLVVMLAGCDVGDTSMANGEITLKGQQIVLRVDHASDGVITSSGDFSVADQPISVSPAQRGLLVMYYQSVSDVHHTGVDMGKLGVRMSAHAVADTLKGSPDSSKEQGGQSMDQLAARICQDQINIKQVQDQLAAQLPAFKPYGQIIDQETVDDCRKDNK